MVNLLFLFSTNLVIVIDSIGLVIAKYIEENLYKILKTILKTQALAFNGFYKKFLKSKSLDVYYSKSYRKYYNFC